MTKWNKREKSTSMNNKQTDDNQYRIFGKNIHTQKRTNSVKHMKRKRINVFKNIFGEQLMDLIHHILVLKSTFVEMLIMMLK